MYQRPQQLVKLLLHREIRLAGLTVTSYSKYPIARVSLSWKLSSANTVINSVAGPPFLING
jgi:hypothetical protein